MTFNTTHKNPTRQRTGPMSFNSNVLNPMKQRIVKGFGRCLYTKDLYRKNVNNVLLTFFTQADKRNNNTNAN